MCCPFRHNADEMTDLDGWLGRPVQSVRFVNNVVNYRGNFD